MLKRAAACVLGLCVLALAPSRVWADDTPGAENKHPIVQLAKQTVFDPTTYAPAVLGYTSTRLDWNTSQPFFRNGYVEENSRYTVSGRGHDVPVGYYEGNRRIFMDMISVVPTSMANNALARATERALTNRFPNQRKLIRVLSWIERTGFASYLSYRVSEKHFSQWRQNVNGARALGF